jgi:hypothetical protein
MRGAGKLMCPYHWSMVPTFQQREVYAAYHEAGPKPRQLAESVRYQAARSVALATVKIREAARG